MGKLVLLRHGQSLWNQKNIFTGWVDVSLSQKGIDEAIAAGEAMKDITFDGIYVSKLMRAQMTAELALSRNKSDQVLVLVDETRSKDREKFTIFDKETKKSVLFMYESDALNERHYGELQGRNKAQIQEEFGEEQFKLWRRSYDVPPPKGESLQMTIERSLPYFKEKILPHMERGETILISAHGNTLRGIIMYLDGLSKQEVVSLEIPTGKPILYTYQNKTFVKGTL